MMYHKTREMVMDVLPWPKGQGFSGADAWWEYVLSKDEEHRLNNLVGLALLDEAVSKRLLVERDPALFKAFGLSDETQRWLRLIPATNLVEFAQAIVRGQAGQYAEMQTASEAA
jgi:hypothetical protein